MSRLFHVSDLHFGRADTDALTWFADIVHAERPDALIVTGDLTFRARSAEFAAAADWLAQFDVQITLEAGNHDLPYYNPFRRLFGPYSRYGRVERMIEDALDLTDVAVVPLRTTSRFQLRTNWSRGVVRGHNLEKTLVELAEVPPAKLAIIACHHPLTDIAELERPQRTHNGVEALHRLARGGARAVLSGHVHDPFDSVWSVAGPDVRLIGAGTLSERVRTSPPSFNELRVEGRALEVIVRDMAGRAAPLRPIR